MLSSYVNDIRTQIGCQQSNVHCKYLKVCSTEHNTLNVNHHRIHVSIYMLIVNTHPKPTHDDEDMTLPITHMRFGPIVKICEGNIDIL